MSVEPPPEALPFGDVTSSQWRAMKPFVSVSLATVIAGGLVAAVTGPTGFAEGAWMAAYLVLVPGVAQLGLGVGQALLAVAIPSTRYRQGQFVGYNLGCLAVVVGTLTGTVAIVMAGGALLCIALVLFLRAVDRSSEHLTCLRLYRILAVVLTASILVGLVLSLLRHG